MMRSGLDWQLFWFAIVLLTGMSTAAMPVVAEKHAATPTQVVVTGSGKLEVAPDQVNFVVGIDAKQPTARQAYSSVEEKMQQAMAILMKSGIPEHNIQAMALSLQPVVDYKQRDQVIAHDARRDIAVKVENIELYAKVMQQLANIDIMRFQQVKLSSSQQKQLELEVLQKAYENAESKARELAAKSGQSLGRAIAIIEQGAVQLPQPMSRGVAMMAAESESATVSAGLISISARVSVTFELHES